MYRVLMVAPTPFFSDRGCHIRIYEEAKHLSRLDVEIKLLTYNLGEDLPEVNIIRAKSWLRYKRIEAGPSWRKIFLDISLLRRLRELIEEFKPVLIHSHLHEGAFLSLQAVKDSIPVLLDYQGSLFSELKTHSRWFSFPLIKQMTRAVEKNINKRVRAILLNSQSLFRELGEVKEKVKWVGDGVDLERFYPQAPPGDLKPKLGLKNEPILVYLGLLTPYQGIDLLLEALKILSRRGREFKALIMGYPEYKYRRRAEKMGLKNQVLFTGRMDYFQAPKYLALGKIALAPKISQTESNGKILNYLAMGLPVVCFDREVNRELAGDFAEYVSFVEGDEAGSAENFAQGIERLFDSPLRCRELGEGARAWVEERYSWGAVAGRIFSVYQGLISN